MTFDPWFQLVTSSQKLGWLEPCFTLNLKTIITIVNKNTEGQLTVQSLCEAQVCVDQWHSCIYAAAGFSAKQWPKNEEKERKWHNLTHTASGNYCVLKITVTLLVKSIFGIIPAKTSPILAIPFLKFYVNCLECSFDNWSFLSWWRLQKVFSLWFKWQSICH